MLMWLCGNSKDKCLSPSRVY